MPNGNNNSAFSTKSAAKKVMWVEDDKFLSDMLARKLSSEGFQLVCTDKGDEVVATAEKNMPDVILLDILLPGADGFEIIKKLKAHPKLKNIPVIFLSNLGQKSDVEKGKSLGAEKFLIKATVTLEEIVNEVKSVLASSGKNSSY